MAGRIKSRRTLSLLILLSLLSLTELFEVKDDEWEELGPDIAALHRLRGLSEHMFHERLQNASDQRVDVDQSLQQCEEGFTSCDTQIKQHVDDQKIQVQQEYSMDPHYSVIVSKECLFNVSCVPEADSDTVVKIFGRVSEDGQTVSGLKAVLETKQGNHQIYQVMNQPDSVSRYQIPQRAVDHSTQYDHQQILIMQDDPTVRKAATSLYEKHPAVTSVYVLDQNQRPKLIQVLGGRDLALTCQATPEHIRGLDEALLSLSLRLLQRVGLHVILPIFPSWLSTGRNIWNDGRADKEPEDSESHYPPLPLQPH
ncbi:uncharacterized protein LOC123960355 [Micropterus dolomieu]|uniref:uncharacterized protein LOC123960355 n=1 Tax=Micropterus dolomieu TaxID=147949 RepID=UPI001E8E6BC7|nr:uncharacterized protein LOC123960355 [Micropterus dolomieu]